MSEWNLGRLFRIGVAYFVGVYTGNWQLLAAQLVREASSVSRSKQQRRALERYSASLKDRLEMVDLTPDSPRTLVLGRVRHVEGVRRRWTSGVNQEKLTLIVSFAGHEIDGFEQWYVDDNAVTLDANGWVQEVPYRKVGQVNTFQAVTLDAAGAATVVLANTPVGAVLANWSTGSGERMAQGSASVSMAGLTATVTGGQPGALANVIYQHEVAESYLRIRPYLGAAGQNVGAALAAEYPGKITTTDRFEGIALAVVDLIYTTDAFTQGRPNITAVMRGAKCLDPRTGVTAWTQNPAVQAYHYARLPSGWALGTSSIRTADVSAAADVCDLSTSFTMRKVDATTSVVVLPRYRSGMTIPSDADHGEAMDALVDAMAGRTGWAGGLLRMRAGTLGATVATVTDSWLAAETRGGRADDEPVITAVQSAPREQRFNRVTGRCVDPAQRYQVLPFPAVQDAVLVAAKGERPLEVVYEAVDHIAHAQHLATIAIREAQAGLRLDLRCGEEAGLLELFDVVAVTLPKYGYSAKTFEVTGWEWQQQGAYRLQLAEITAALFTPVAELVGRDPAPDSNIRDPWNVEQLTGLIVTSGTAAVTDPGSILIRTTLTWNAAIGESIRRGGQVEAQYTEATGTLPTGEWPSWVEPGTATKAVIPGLLAGRFYLFRVRPVQPLPLVRGAWSSVVRHQVGSAPLVETGGLTSNATTDSFVDLQTGSTNVDPGANVLSRTVGPYPATVVLVVTYQGQLDYSGTFSGGPSQVTAACRIDDGVSGNGVAISFNPTTGAAATAGFAISKRIAVPASTSCQVHGFSFVGASGPVLTLSGLVTNAQLIVEVLKN